MNEALTMPTLWALIVITGARWNQSEKSLFRLMEMVITFNARSRRLYRVNPLLIQKGCGPAVIRTLLKASSKTVAYG